MARRPSKGTPVTDKERQRIIEALRGGKSIHAVATEFRRAKQTVGKIAKAAGLTPDDTHVKAANEARTNYADAQRIGLINKAFAKVEKLVDLFPDNPAASRDLRELVTALGILIDKRRLEDGDVTERTEQITIIDDIGE